MRRAQYRIPGAGGAEAGECVVFYFGAGQGGDVRGNIDRWAMQFRGAGGAPATPRVTEVKAGDKTVTRVEVQGTYTPSSMMMGGTPPAPRPGYALLGAIAPGADANWFFRCTGPEKTIEANRARFDKMIASLHAGS
ncbi:MAG TPA: hypothetical protein VFT43_07955 [Candidatus Polarisedimenticolia bacterium]|nr:hypothetical protein [Candidatus Polarisedimenticolia bacterium]